MASINANIDCRLRWYARWLLYIAALMAWMGCKLPHGWIVAVTNRSWQLRSGGKWLNIRIDNQGRRIGMSAATVTMRDFIALETLVPTNDARWGQGGQWQQFAQVWAEVLPQTGTAAGTEQFSNQGVQTVLGFIITMRYRTDVDAKDRIIYRGQPLEILSVVDPDGLRRTLELNCKLYAGVQT